MPDFLLEQLSYSLSHILSTTLYIPRNILGIIYSQDIFIAVESEKLASECNFPRAFRKKSTHRAKSSYPRCQHSCSEIIFAKKPPKRRNMPGICLTKQSQPLEYHHIPHWSAGTVPQDPLYSAEYSGTRSFQTPPIFRKKFRNIWQRPSG